jgi:hypothetical protein
MHFNPRTMKLSTIKKVKELYSDEEVNKYLDKGYELIKIISSRSMNLDVDEVRPCYVLGLRDTNKDC